MDFDIQPTKIRLFTLPHCPRCPEAKQLVDKVALSRSDVIVEVLDMSTPENLTTALMLQIASTPSICVDEEIVSIGEVPSFESLNAIIERHRQNRLMR